MSTEIMFHKPEQKNSMSSASISQESKGVSEVQAQFIIAKKFPRDENACYTQIIRSCERHSLAEQAMYAYPRGGQLVTGPSIRLAEVLAQKWTNCRIGIEILSQTNDSTEARAYANDLENNYMVDSCFTVKHQRTTKKGITRLTDEREIRELVANIGSRHLRGCILRIIPGDVVESATDKCRTTLESSDIPMADQIRKLVLAFDDLGVKSEHLEKRLGHKLDAIIPAEIVTLRSIFRSIKDGMADRSQFFDIASVAGESARNELLEAVGKNKKELVDELTKNKDNNSGSSE
jgi:hypothetical protein